MDHPVGVQSDKVKGGREQVSPAQAPEYGTLDAGKDTGKENGRARVVGEVWTACYFVK